MCLVTGQQFRYSHNLPHTCMIMEVHRKPDLLASASFVLNDNHLFPSHSYPPIGKIWYYLMAWLPASIYRKHVGMIFWRAQTELHV